MRSRLFQEVRERLGLAYSVDSFASTLQDTGAMGIYAGVAPARCEETICAILGELDRMRQEPVPEEELSAAKEFVKGRLALSLEDSFARVALFARQELLGPEVFDHAEITELFDEVQVSDIQDLARILFQEERLNLAIVGPFSQDGDRFRDAMRF
jgi:predicted Zn-dependent peptidase